MSKEYYIWVARYWAGLAICNVVIAFFLAVKGDASWMLSFGLAGICGYMHEYAKERRDER